MEKPGNSIVTKEISGKGEIKFKFPLREISQTLGLRCVLKSSAKQRGVVCQRKLSRNTPGRRREIAPVSRFPFVWTVVSAINVDDILVEIKE